MMQSYLHMEKIIQEAFLILTSAMTHVPDWLTKSCMMFTKQPVINQIKLIMPRCSYIVYIFTTKTMAESSNSDACL